jgi:hypothetical protein
VETFAFGRAWLKGKAAGIALDAIEALGGTGARRMVVNVPNGGAIPQMEGGGCRNSAYIGPT